MNEEGGVDVSLTIDLSNVIEKGFKTVQSEFKDKVSNFICLLQTIALKSLIFKNTLNEKRECRIIYCARTTYWSIVVSYIHKHNISTSS